MSHWLTTFFLLCGLMATAEAAKNDTPDNWKCDNRVGGSWTFGRAPSACDVAPFANPDSVTDQFQPVIFDDGENESAERNRYMNDLYTVVRDLSAYYIKQRKPSVGAAEISAWQKAIYAKAHQESFWSHYRKANGQIKMMRGDSGHGHGLMQIDDRWHFADINNGAGWHLVTNVLQGMEEFYTAWERAPSQSCVPSATSWRTRARAAYSAYNGGPKQICRFTNPNDTWARNDKGYVDKYDSESWLNNVADTNATSPIDAICIAEEQAQCDGNSTPNPEPTTPTGQLLKLSSGEHCLLVNEQLQCVEQAQDSACLTLFDEFDGSIMELSDSAASNLSKTVHDRHLCPKNMASLRGVGEAITLLKSINVRTTPGGTKMTVASAGKAYQVLDFVIKEPDTLKRYYRIQHDGDIGYVYAGKSSDEMDWSEATDIADVTYIAQSGQAIKITATNGINMRQTPGGQLLTRVPNDSVVEVIETHVQGTANYVYYQVGFDGQTGYVYGGMLLANSTLADWAVLTEDSVPPPPVTQRTGLGGSQLWYTFLRDCASTSCAQINHYVIGLKLDDLCQGNRCRYRRDSLTELATDGEWSQVRVNRDGAEGWLKTADVDWQ